MPGPNSLYDIVTFSQLGEVWEFWEWMRAGEGLLDLWGDNGQIDSYNYLIGGIIRLTQLRVKVRHCLFCRSFEGPHRQNSLNTIPAKQSKAQMQRG